MSLAKPGPGAEEAIPKLTELLNDSDRYVRGKALEALKRLGTDRSKEILIENLMRSRWCDITTKDNLF